MQGFSANDALKMTHGCLNITKKALFCATMLAPAAGPLGLLIMPALAILTEAVDAVDVRPCSLSSSEGRGCSSHSKSTPAEELSQAVHVFVRTAFLYA